MKSIATSLLFLLLAATSACATDATADLRAAPSTERSAPITDATRSTQAPASTGTRKHERCRSHFKTVGIACQKRPSR